MSLSAKINNRWLREYSDHTRIVYETVADGGLGPASWTMLPRLDGTLPPLMERDRVEIYDAGQPVWRGRIETYGRTTGAVTTRSVWADAAGVPGLASDGTTTRDVAQAITKARTNLGWWVETAPGVTGTVHGDNSEPMMMDTLLAAYGTQTGRRVGVDGRGQVYARLPETSPSWRIDGADIEIGGIDLSQPNAFAARYINALGELTTAYRPWPLPAHTVATLADLTERGRLPTPQAHAILDAALTKAAQNGPRWLNGLTLHWTQITTMSGAHPTSWGGIVAGQVARITSLTAAQMSQVGAPYLDVELGRVVITDDSDTIYVEPLNTPPQSLTEALEAIA